MHTYLDLLDTDIFIFLSPRRLENVFKTCLEDAFKVCLQDVFKDMFSRRLEDVFSVAIVHPPRRL